MTSTSYSEWRPLFRVAALASLAMILLMIGQMVAFIVVPPPSFVPSHDAALAWFTLFERRPLVGLMHLDALLVLDYVLIPVLYLALWGRAASDPAGALTRVARVLFDGERDLYRVESGIHDAVACRRIRRRYVSGVAQRASRCSACDARDLSRHTLRCCLRDQRD